MLPLFRGMQSLIDGINRVLRDQLSGVRVVRAFTREHFERERFAKANTALSSTALTAGNWQALMLPVTTLTINVSSVALIWFGGLRIDSGQMQVGSLIAFLVLLHPDPVGGDDGDDDAGQCCRAHRCAPNGSPRCSSTRPPSKARSTPRSRETGSPAWCASTARHSAIPAPNRPVLQDVSLTASTRYHHRDRGQHRFGQVDAGVADLPALRRHRRRRADRRRRCARLRHRAALVGDRAGAPARLPVLRHRRGQPPLRRGPRQ